MKASFIIGLSLIFSACQRENKSAMVTASLDSPGVLVDSHNERVSSYAFIASHVTPHELVNFAKTLIGTPYQYACTDPSKGFDCSGFVNYVFNHFYIEVPRSSVDFTNFGKDVALKDAEEGDLILFTGTDDTKRVVGHIGIVTENADTLKFIHSSSGKSMGVTISPLGEYYQKRFVKVIRVF